MHVLMAASEMAPFAKTGGLADVVSALPPALARKGCQTKIFLPLYLMVEQSNLPTEIVYEGIPLELGNERFVGNILRYKMSPEMEVYFVQQQQFFYREGLYGTAQGDYADNAKRFIFFSKMILRYCELAGYTPEVIHCHDWQTGLIPVYLKHLPRIAAQFQKSVVVFTIHNIAYQGLFPAALFPLTNLPPSVFTVDGFEYWGKMNFMKAGINFADYITTVSEKYSDEIKTPEFGYGIDGILRNRAGRLVGILNGVDYSVWDPATDPLIVANYSSQKLSGKKQCKADLLSEFNLPKKLMNKPLLGIISRLVDQKGFDLLAEIIDQLMQRDLALILLGTGEQKYHTLFQTIAEEFPAKTGIRIAYDNPLAHRIEAGSDIFLMPSKYEPCGLNQIYSLKYGTVPIVRATGGLDDTIQPFDLATETGNGFKFVTYSPADFLKTIDTALDLYRQKKIWRKLMQNAMQADYSWERSAEKYFQLYEQALEQKRSLRY